MGGRSLPRLGGSGWPANLAPRHQLLFAKAALLAGFEKRLGNNGNVGARAIANREVRDARTRSCAVPAEVGQRADVRLSGLYAPREQWRTPTRHQ